MYLHLSGIQMKAITLLIVLLMPLTSLLAKNDARINADLSSEESNTYKLPLVYLQQAETLYDSLQLASAGLEKEVFLKAYKGYFTW